MNAWKTVGTITVSLIAGAFAQAASEYSIVERGPDHRVLERVTLETNLAGGVIGYTNRYTELATGMHFQRGDEWVEAKADIELTGDGAAATNTARPVAFAPNLNRVGAVDLTLPDGRHLRSRVIGLSFFDSASGETVMLGRVRDTVGLLYAPNQVIYTNAFDGALTADVQLVCSLAGFEQNIVLRSQPPAPGDVGLRAETTLLQVITEFFDAPVPAREATVDAAGNITDETLNFSGLVMGPGKAFAVGYADDRPARVFKRWVTLDSGRTFLVEQVPLTTVATSLQRLPAGRQGAALPRSGSGKSLLAGLESVLPESLARPTGSVGAMARVDTWSPRGLVMDYSIVSAATNFTFQGDTTYLVTNTVNLSGTTHIEGGTVVKFSTNVTAQINLSGTIDCQTGPYRPAIFTSRDDNTVGEIIAGSTGTPTNYHGTIGITSSGNQLEHLRFSHLQTAVNLDLFGPGQLGLANVQFVQCRYPLRASLFACLSGCEAAINLDNALAYGCDVFFQGVAGYLRARHLTVNQCNTLGYDDSGDSGMYLTNSLLVAVTNWGNFVTTNTDHTPYYASDPGGMFQTVGAGAHYLANDSTNRNAGTTNLSASLLATLQQTTTHPPVEITTNFTGVTVLAPRAARDTDTPDLGYHYDPLDFVVSGRTVSAALTLTNGMALGTYGGAASPGLRLDGGGSLDSAGSPARLNWIARYHAVQEQASTNWTAATAGGSVTLLSSVPVNVRFTGWSVLGGTGSHFYDLTAGAAPSAFSYCRFGGGEFKCDPGSAALTNCLWERTYLTLNDGGDALQWYLCNNLFSGGRLWHEAHSEDTVTLVCDNLFDRTTITKSPGTENLTHDHNGYVTNQNRLTPNGAGDVILTNTPTYLTNQLGRYYYPTNDGMLSLLLDAGSRAADTAGLYHFTVTTNQVKETNSTVDIGFHYAALSGDGETPADADGDGLPDYFEDRNANGLYDAGDLADWRDPDTDYDGIADRDEFFSTATNFCSGVVTTNLSYTAATNATVFQPKRLAFFRFNTNDWPGERGQLPLTTSNLDLVDAWATKGVQLTNSAAQLIYRTVETNDGRANINLRSGTVRFWFKPRWESDTTNAPAEGARLLEVGQPNSNGWWAVYLAADGANLWFVSQTNGAGVTTNLVTAVPFASNQWHQLALTFTNGAIEFYLNGTNWTATTNNFACPGWEVRTNGFSLGCDIFGGHQALGVFEDLETFNYPLTASNILADFEASRPPNLIPDLQHWLIASAVTATNPVDRVKVWLDQSGRTNHAIAVDSQRPYLVTNAVNGWPVLRFYGAEYFNSYLGSFVTTWTQAEAFVVLRCTSNVPTNNPGIWRLGSAAPLNSHPATTGEISDNFGSQSSNFKVGSLAQGLTNFHLYNPLSRQGEWAARLNGVLKYHTSVNTVGFTANPDLGYGNNEFRGDMAELLLFNRALTATERTCVNRYLGEKHALMPVPQAPTNLTVNVLAPTQASIWWNHSGNLDQTRYIVERSTDGANFVPVAEVEGASWIDSGLATNSFYYYRVKAINLTAESAYTGCYGITTAASGVPMPLDSGNLKLWLKADAGPLANYDGTVNQWLDQSGNSNVVIYTLNQSATQRPFILTSASAVNNHPILKFYGSNWFAIYFTESITNWTEAEAFIVLRAVTNAVVGDGGLWRFGHSSSVYVSTTDLVVGDDFASAYQWRLTNAASYVLNYHLFNPSSSYGGLWSARFNGNEVFSVTTNVVQMNVSLPTLGLGLNKFGGDILEVLIYERPLSPVERVAPTEYVKRKYNLW